MKRGSDAGITLIELLVALAIIGVIFGLSAVALRDVFDVGLKDSSRRLSSLVRYLRIRAVTEHKYVRLVLDLEGAKYWVEETTDPFVISPEEEEAPKEKEEAEEGSAGEPAAEFQKSEGRLVAETRLSSGVFFKDVEVSYLKGKREQGKASIYFFPDGYTTPAMIHLKDEEDDDHFSLEVFPMNGKVSVESEYVEWRQ